MKRSCFAATAFGTVLALGGCNPAGPPPDAGMPPSPPSAGQCDAAGARWAEGERARDPIIERARRDAGAERVRVVGPDQAVTMEFDSERLTVEVDRRDRIARVACG